MKASRVGNNVCERSSIKVSRVQDAVKQQDRSLQNQSELSRVGGRQRLGCGGRFVC